MVTGTVRSAALATAPSMEHLVRQLSGALTEVGMGRDVMNELFDEDACKESSSAHPISSIYSRDRAVKIDITSA